MSWSARLALDLGTHTGWAAERDGQIESGVHVLDVKRGESPGMRYLRLDAWLTELTGLLGGVRLVAYEQAHHRGGAATEVGVGLMTRVQAWCALHGVEHVGVHTATIKKAMTGKGNANKAAMQAAARLRWPQVRNDNEADALALLTYVQSQGWGAGPC